MMKATASHMLRAQPLELHPPISKTILKATQGDINTPSALSLRNSTLCQPHLEGHSGNYLEAAQQKYFLLLTDHQCRVK